MTTEEAHYETTHGPTVEADHVYFDEEPKGNPVGADSMRALLSVVFELGAWAGKDPVKQYAARIIMRQETVSVQAFATEHGVSDSFVRRRIREARAQVGSAAEADE